MADFFFANNSCGLADIPQPIFDFIDDCIIAPPPEPIFDCPPIDIPIDPPAVDYDSLFSSFSVPCPILNFTGSLSFGEPAFTITTTRIGGVDCETEVSLDIQIPVPDCPVFNTAATIAVAGTEPGVTLAFNSAGPCEFDVNLDIQIPLPPCPVFDAAATVAYGGPSAAATLTFDPVGDDCSFNVSLDLQIPAPPCPTFNTSSTIMFGETPDVDFTVTPVGSPEACEFNADLNIVIPYPGSPPGGCTPFGINIVTTCGTAYGYAVTDPSTCSTDLNLFFDFDGCFGSNSGSSGSGSCTCEVSCGSAMDTSNVYCIDVCGVTWFFNNCGQFVGVLVPDNCCPPECGSTASGGTGDVDGGVV